MKKRNLILIGLIVTAMLLLIGCAVNNNEVKTENKNNSASEELKEIRVAVQDYFISSSIGYMVENNIDEKFGLDIKLIEYPSGAEQIKDIEDDLYDVATIGTAYLEPLAQNQAVLIGELIKVTGGNGIYVRSGDPILDVKGFNPTYPLVFGNYETLVDRTVMLKKDTTQQYLGMKWLESIGVKKEKVHFIYENRNYEKLFSRFMNNEGDVVALSGPDSYRAERNGLRKVADTESLNMNIYEVLLATKKAHGEKRDELISFIECLLYTNEILEKDMSEKIDAGEKWYELHGQDISHKDIKAECKDKVFVTCENYDIEKFGEYEKKYAEYMAALGNISPLVLENVDNNIDSELFETALRKAGER